MGFNVVCLEKLSELFLVLELPVSELPELYCTCTCLSFITDGHDRGITECSSLLIAEIYLEFFEIALDHIFLLSIPPTVSNNPANIEAFLVHILSFWF